MPPTGNLAAPLQELPMPQQSAPQQSYGGDPHANMQLDPPPQIPNYKGGKAGVIADYADKFLNGWMAGIKIKEDKQRNKAMEEIGSAKSGLDIIGQSYKAAVESGDQAKIAQTKKALGEAWNDYIAKAEKYVTPAGPVGKDGKPKKEGAGKRMKEQFTGHPIEMFQQSSLNILKQTDPTTLFGPSKEDQLKTQELEQRMKGQQQQFDMNKLTMDDQKKVTETRDAYQKALASGDKSEIAKQEQALSSFGIKIEPQYKQQLERKIADTAIGAMDKMNSGKVKNFSELSDIEQGALIGQGLAVQAKNPVQAYLSQVGPGKKFANEYEAAHKFMLDSTTSRVMGMKPTALEEIAHGERVILAHDLQDPKIAEKYGIAPLKPGQKPPEWLVQRRADERYRATPQEKADVKLYSDMAQGRVINNALKTFSLPEQEQIKALFLTQDDDSGRMIMNPTPDLSKLNQQQKDQYRQLYGTFRNRLQRWSKDMYGTDQDKFNEVFGDGPEEFGYKVQAPPNQKLDTPPDKKLDKPPAKPKQYAANGWYTIKKGGQSAYGGTAAQLTAEQAKKLADAGYELSESQ